MRSTLCALLLLLLPAASRGAEPDFEVDFSGNGRIQSFAYFKQGTDNLIDTVIRLEGQMLRYRKTFFVFRFENETDMGQGLQAGMPFDPNRGRWTFGVESRTELEQNYFALFLRHDCYHGIDRYFPGEDYKMSAAGVGFGSSGYLEKNRFRNVHDSAAALEFPLQFNYGLSGAVYLPRGTFWQRSPYGARVEADLRFDLLRWKRLGLGVESINVFYATHSNELQRLHELDVNLFLYGTAHALRAFFAWWPHDSQVLRRRDGRTVAGLELSF